MSGGESNRHDGVPAEVLRAAWRVDKAWERHESLDAIYFRIKILAWVCEEHGFYGVASWIREIVEREGVPMI